MKHIKLFEDIDPLTPKDIELATNDNFKELETLLVSLKQSILLHKMHLQLHLSTIFSDDPDLNKHLHELITIIDKDLEHLLFEKGSVDHLLAELSM